MSRNNKQLKRSIRASYTLSTISIALVLFLLGTVGYLILNAVSATDRLKESVTVNIMLKDGLRQGQMDSVGVALRALPAVRKAEFVPRAQAAANFKAYSGDDFEAFLGVNPLPDGYRVGMKAEASNSDSLCAFEKQVVAWPEVDEVLYQRTVVEQITQNIGKFLLILVFFGGTFLVISVVLLNNTIRAAVYSKRFIINTMKLVGATRRFILMPFMRAAMLQGFVAALIAGALFLGMLAGLQQGLPSMTLLLHDLELVVIVGGMILGGMLISVIFTGIAVNKFINMKTRNIHLY